MPPILTLLGLGQLRHRFNRDQDGKLFEPLGNLHPHLRGPGNQPRAGMFFQDGKELLQRGGPKELFAVLLVLEALEPNGRFGERTVKPVGPLLFPLLERNQGRIPDRPVAGAAAEVSAQLIVQLPIPVHVLAVVALEHRHDEAGGAVAALGTVVGRHRRLHRVRTAVLQSFHRHHIPSGHQDQRGQTAVDRPVGRFPGSIRLRHRHRTGPAVPLRTTFLGTGPAARPQPIQQREIRGDPLDPHLLAIQLKGKAVRHGLRLSPLFPSRKQVQQAGDPGRFALFQAVGLDGGRLFPPALGGPTKLVQ